jgi:hypothetical protein
MLLVGLCATSAYSQALVIRSEPVHLRSGQQREWRSFPAEAHGPNLSVTFDARENATEYSLLLRQRDVKAAWIVTLNGSELGQLIQDERDMLRVLAIPARTLRSGSNRLEITSKPANFSDDVEIRDLRMESVPVADLQRQATIDVAVLCDQGKMPVRVTVVDRNGSLAPITSLRNKPTEAVRIGVIYTSDGHALIGVPAGEYRIYASRGFEYSAPSKSVRVDQGERSSVSLRIEREVEIPNHVSCDTHVHTLELSGHGDATVQERALTAAGEGLDLVVATEHNRFAQYSLSSIRGTEVTTAIGHFNIFPVAPGAVHPDVKETDWGKLMKAMKATEGVRVVVQNHPRDIHSGYRPFDPQHHISSVGENLNGSPFLANAMEVVNSGAMASDPLQLVRDWMGLLTRGLQVAAVGASDTHTVDFVPIGQARTYIDVSGIQNWRNDHDAVARRLAAGRNLVSYGLAVDLNPGKSGVEVTVWGPSWATADQVTIFSNGIPVWKRSLDSNRKGGRKFRETVDIPTPSHDVALVALVTGPGVLQPFWEVRKPYQPTSDEWTPIIFGVSRAVWLDGDNSKSKESPLDYARRLLALHKSDVAALAQDLGHYDASVTMHVMNLLK